MQNKIKHVFVVMLENRSFDHLLGFSAIQGRDAESGLFTSLEGIRNPHELGYHYPAGSEGIYYPGADAGFKMKVDPGHEFKDVLEQLCGKGAVYSPLSYPSINQQGFVDSFAALDPKSPGAILQCFSEKRLPVLHQLAREFTVCDHWFSSLPGPTWPNRFFLHAASSGGLDDSPPKRVLSVSNFENEFNFEHGHIFDRLFQNNIHWVIYEGDEFPQSYALQGMQRYHDLGYIRPFNKFKGDLQEKNFSPSYIFIEPNYGYVLTGNESFKCGNSQHPLDDVTSGERLLKAVYEAIRNSPHWESSCLVITYDEHGGFYDHMTPPRAIPPGDKIVKSEYQMNHFTFDQLGVRVPSVIVSPWIPRNTIDHTCYDHTSLLRTLGLWLNLEPLTNRDKYARPFSHLFSLSQPRTDAPNRLVDPARSKSLTCHSWRLKVENFLAQQMMKFFKSKEIAAATRGFLHLAFLKKMHAAGPKNSNKMVDDYNQIEHQGQAIKFIEASRRMATQDNLLNQREKDQLFVGRNAKTGETV
ncbi:MAG: alkaline phosphatase family protein [Chitinophagaceae bacterium]